MTPEQREAVRSNAKYLREVRPIDPEEIYEYVEGRPHPAAVRQVLRESAFELGLVEREDGTFEPVPEAPVTGLDGPVESFPARYARTLEDLLVEAYGPDWATGESGAGLRETVSRIKEAYHRGQPVEYDETTAHAYAVYHLPDYYAAVQYVLDELTERSLLGRQLRVLDVGAGVCGPALGLHDLLPPDALVEYHGVEPSPAAGIGRSMLGETGRNFHWTLHTSRAESFDPVSVAPVDLLVFANVLSELSDPRAVLERYVEALAEDGTLLMLAPADRETAIGLRDAERFLADGDAEVDVDLTVYSPTVRLWPDARPTDRGWSFDVKPDLEVPAFQRRLDEPAGATGEFVNVDVQYAFALLRPDGVTRVAFVPDADRLARMADMEAHVTDRIDCAAIKLSHDLSDAAADGANPLFKIGDGSEAVDHYAVLTRETGLNRDLRTADYGALLLFEGALVLWNDDEGAYNLVVDDETVVDRLR